MSSTSPTQKKKLLFFARGVGEYTETLTNAELLSDRYAIVIVSDFPLTDGNKRNLVERAQQMGSVCYDISIPALKVKKRKKSYRDQFLNKKKGQGLLTHLRHAFFILLRNLLLKKKAFISLLEKESPDLFIINNVNGGTYSEIFIKECRKRHIRTILIPFTFASPQAPAKRYSTNPLFTVSGLRKALVWTFARRWLYSYKNKTMIRLPIAHILVQKILGIETPLPWVQDSSHADILVAESEFLRNHYIKSGIPAEKIELTGKPNMDYLSTLHHNRSRLRTEILGELRLSARKKTVLIGIPPALNILKEEQYASEFSTHGEIIDFWLSQLKSLNNYNVIICLHPSLKGREDCMSMFEPHLSSTIKISLRDTAELLSISDLYIACGSGTILWSLALGIPVIDHDVLGLGLESFKDNSDVLTLKSKLEFTKTLNQLNNDPEFLPALTVQLQKKKSYYGLLDGKSVERIQQRIERFTSSQRALHRKRFFHSNKKRA